MYELFEHTADLGLRVTAADLETLFAEAGRGFFAVLVSNLEEVRLEQDVRFEIAGVELDYLLLDWLNELLFVFESQRLLLARFDVQLTGEGLRATASGEPISERHRLANEIKAITYHGLKVEQQANGWLAEVIVDI